MNAPTYCQRSVTKQGALLINLTSQALPGQLFIPIDRKEQRLIQQRKGLCVHLQVTEPTENPLSPVALALVNKLTAFEQQLRYLLSRQDRLTAEVLRTEISQLTSVAARCGNLMNQMRNPANWKRSKECPSCGYRPQPLAIGQQIHLCERRLLLLKERQAAMKLQKQPLDTRSNTHVSPVTSSNGDVPSLTTSDGTDWVKTRQEMRALKRRARRAEKRLRESAQQRSPKNNRAGVDKQRKPAPTNQRSAPQGQAASQPSGSTSTQTAATVSTVVRMLRTQRLDGRTLNQREYGLVRRLRRCNVTHDCLREDLLDQTFSHNGVVTTLRALPEIDIVSLIRSKWQFEANRGPMLCIWRKGSRQPDSRKHAKVGSQGVVSPPKASGKHGEGTTAGRSRRFLSQRQMSGLLTKVVAILAEVAPAHVLLSDADIKAMLHPENQGVPSMEQTASGGVTAPLPPPRQ